jgi:hypothetical protein
MFIDMVEEDTLDRAEIHIKFQSENLKGACYGKIILKCFLKVQQSGPNSFRYE